MVAENLESNEENKNFEDMTDEDIKRLPDYEKARWADWFLKSHGEKIYKTKPGAGSGQTPKKGSHKSRN